MKLDISKIRLIPEADVPLQGEHETKYDLLFASIPLGQAVVFNEGDISPSGVRRALKMRQGRGRFTYLRVVTWRDEEGTLRIYVLNPIYPKRPDARLTATEIRDDVSNGDTARPRRQEEAAKK